MDDFQYNEPNLTPPPEGVRTEQISGDLPRVTATPTWTPQSFRDSLALNTNTATLYYYDFTNNAWKSVSNLATVTYGGKMGASAASPTLPTGWTVAFDGATKIFTVTHNLNTTSYVVTAAAEYAEGVTYYAADTSFLINSFQIRFFNAASVVGDTGFNFVLTIIS